MTSSNSTFGGGVKVWSNNAIFWNQYFWIKTILSDQALVRKVCFWFRNFRFKIWPCLTRFWPGLHKNIKTDDITQSNSKHDTFSQNDPENGSHSMLVTFIFVIYTGLRGTLLRGDFCHTPFSGACKLAVNARLKDNENSFVTLFLNDTFLTTVGYGASKRPFL